MSRSFLIRAELSSQLFYYLLTISVCVYTSLGWMNGRYAAYVYTIALSTYAQAHTIDWLYKYIHHYYYHRLLTTSIQMSLNRYHRYLLNRIAFDSERENSTCQFHESHIWTQSVYVCRVPCTLNFQFEKCCASHVRSQFWYNCELSF